MIWKTQYCLHVSCRWFDVLILICIGSRDRIHTHTVIQGCDVVSITVHASFAHFWKCISAICSLYRSFTAHMQQGIKKDPVLVIQLRATFLKVYTLSDILVLYFIIVCIAAIWRIQ